MALEETFYVSKSTLQPQKGNTSFFIDCKLIAKTLRSEDNQSNQDMLKQIIFSE